MTTAEELLNQAVESGVMSEDPKPYLTVDLYTRQIAIPSTVKTIGVESDDEVTRLYFKVPRMFGDTDLSEFHVRINYTNADGDGDCYYPTDVACTDDEITFSWLVGRFAVLEKGNVRFTVCMILYQNDGITIDKEFNTTPTSLPVLEGLETSSAAVEEERDVLAGVAEDAARRAVQKATDEIDEKVEEAVRPMNEKLDGVYSTLANAITKTITTDENFVIMRDISPISHDIHLQLSSNNIPLYPYDTDAQFIAGCDYTITDDGVFEIKGFSNTTSEDIALIKTMTLSAGEYTLQFKGLTGHPFVYFIYGGVEDYISGEYINMFTDDTAFKFPLTKDTTVSLIFKWLGEANMPLDLSIKPYLSKGAEIAPEVSNVHVLVADIDNNQSDYYTDVNGCVNIKSVSPFMLVSVDGDFGLNLSYNVDTNKAIGDIEKGLLDVEEALDSIIAIQENLIGGES